LASTGVIALICLYARDVAWAANIRTTVTGAITGDLTFLDAEDIAGDYSVRLKLIFSCHEASNGREESERYKGTHLDIQGVSKSE
jgi:hypothetical protein